MRGQLHASAAVSLKKGPPLANKQETGLFPEHVRTLCRRKILLALVRNRNPIPQSSILLYYTICVIRARGRRYTCIW